MPDPAQKPFTYVPIDIPQVDHPSADQVLILSEIRALEARVVQRQLWSAASVRELLQGAAYAATTAGDPVKARQAFEEAQTTFQSDVQTKNRMFYLLGVLVGLNALALIAWIVLAAARRLGLVDLAPAEMVLDLFAFAGLGSIASVLSRLSQIDLKDELRKKWVVISAATRPILAIAFASVVYVVLQYGIISFSSFDTDARKKALIWIAAFLCGYSERFAADLLDRLPFSKEG